MSEESREYLSQPVGRRLIKHSFTEPINVRLLNELLGIDIWSVRSFAADVRIDFDEAGRILNATVLNPNPVVGHAVEHSIQDPFTGETTVRVKLD